MNRENPLANPLPEDDQSLPIPSEYLEYIPEEKRDAFIRELILRVQRFQYHYSDPIPSPSMFSDYEEIMPGSGDRILTLVEKQQEHRIKMQDVELNAVIQVEEAQLDAAIQRDRRGMWLGFILALGLLGLSVYGISLGYALESVGLVGGSIASLAGVFVYSHHSSRKDLREKREASKESLTLELPDGGRTDKAD